ncbi:LOW QUALITY PROTEIN: methionyl-tRNA formyltransferase, partial [Micromonospora sp. M42]
MRLVFAGTPAVAVPALDAIAASGHELLAVVTRPDAPAGRGRGLVRSPVGAWADAHGVEVLTPARPREPEFLDRLRELAPDCVPVVAYGALVPPVALEIPRHGWINLHFSLLPAWRGAAPVQHAVLHGDEVTGASVFELEEGLDTGPVYGTVTDEIRPSDTSGDLLEKIKHSGAGLLVAVLDANRRGHRPRRAAAGRRRLARPEADGRGRPGPLGRPRVRGGPARPRLHARARPVDDVPRRPGQARSGHAGGRRPGAEAGGAARGEVRCARRHRHHAGAPRRGARRRQEGHARRRLGARRPGHRRRGVRV